MANDLEVGRRMEGMSRPHTLCSRVSQAPNILLMPLLCEALRTLLPRIPITVAKCALTPRLGLKWSVQSVGVEGEMGE